MCLLLQAAVSHSLDSTNTNVELSEAKVGWYSGPMERGTLSLVWSCVATIIACTWTILHLNVPQQGESPKTKIFRKAKWMAITILFPEFIFSKAVCELRLALKTFREFKETMKLQHQSGTERTDLGRNTRPSSFGWVAQEENRFLHLLYRVMGLGALKSDYRGYSEADGEHDVELGSIRRNSSGGSANSASFSIAQTDPQTEKPFSGTGSVKAFADGRGVASTTQREIEVDEYTDEVQNQTRHTKDTTVRVAASDDPIQTWTLLHSYLANMGGIVYMNSGENLQKRSPFVLTGYHLGRHYQWERKHPLEGLRLSRNDITDKSKADWLLKSLSVLQILSLIVTVTVRGVTSLPLTQLEIVTVAFSIIAIMTYVANWSKPKDISEPVVVLHGTHGRDNSDTDLTNRNSDHSTLDCTVSFVEQLMNPSETYDRKGSVRDAPYVSNDTLDMHGDIPLVVLLMAVSSLLFGGLHCLAWNFDFPSDAELQLWRVASISSALIPMIALGLTILLNYML